MSELLPKKKMCEKIGEKKIKVIGVGTGGMRVVSKMLALGYHDLGLVNILTDESCSSTERRGEMAGVLHDAALAFIIVEPGNSNDAYAAATVASYANTAGVKTIAAVVRPTEYPKASYDTNATESIESMICLSHITIKSCGNLDNATDIDEMCIDEDVLCRYIRSIADLVRTSGPIPFDLSDLQYVRSTLNLTFVGVGEAVGENAPVKAAEAAVKSISDKAGKLDVHEALIGCFGNEKTLFPDGVDVAQAVLNKAAGREVIAIVSALTDNYAEDCVKVVILAA